MNQNYYRWGMPIDISTHGGEIDRLIFVVHVFMAALFIGWLAFLVYSIVRFRQRPGHKAAHQAEHFKLPTYLEVGVALFEVLLLCAFSFPIWNHVRAQFPDKDKALQVRIVAEQFAWNVHYPGKDKIFGKRDLKLIDSSNPLGADPKDPAGKDDVITINQLHIPVDTPVIATLSSKDVIHSFALTVMRVKQDVIPGQTVDVWFQARQTGNFEIACAQLCGLGHYRMRGAFVVDSKEDFKKWMAEQAKS